MWAGIAVGVLIDLYLKKKQRNNQILKNYFNQSQPTTIPPSNWKAPIHNNNNNTSQMKKRSIFHKKQWKNSNYQIDTESYAVQASHQISWIQKIQPSFEKPAEPIENLIVYPF
jgi:hypothetical protein